MEGKDIKTTTKIKQNVFAALPEISHLSSLSPAEERNCRPLTRLWAVFCKSSYWMKPSSFQQTGPNLKVLPQCFMYLSKEDLSLAGELRVETVSWIIQQEKIESCMIKMNLQQMPIRKLSEPDLPKGLCEVIVMRLHSRTGLQHLVILNLKQLKQVLCPLTRQTSDLYFLLYGKGL